jgi:hypothetical protein
MAEEGLPGLTFGLNRSHYAYAAVLGGTAKLLISKGLTDSETDILAFSKRIVTGKRDHSMDEKVPEAEKIAAIYLKDGYTEEVRHMCWDAGFNSPYHVTAAIRKSKAPLESDFELNDISLRDNAKKLAKASLLVDKVQNDYMAGRCDFSVVKDAVAQYDLMMKTGNFAACKRKPGDKGGMGSWAELTMKLETTGHPCTRKIEWPKDDVDRTIEEFRYIVESLGLDTV